MIEEARALRPEARPAIDAQVVAWTMMTLARELANQDRKEDAPDLATATGLISQLVFGPDAKGVA